MNNQVRRTLKNTRARKDGVFVICLILIPTIQFILFYLGVNFNSVLLAFKDYDVATGQFHWNISGNFERFFVQFSATDIFKVALKNSAIASIFTIGLNITLGLIFSLYIYHNGAFGKLFKVILFIPSIISSIVMVKVYAMFCDEGIPTLIKLLFNIKIEGLLAYTKTRWATIIFFNLWVGFGPSMLVYVGAMNGISESISEAARLDGANIIKESWYITIPMIYPTIVIYIISGLTAILTNQLSLYSFYGDAAKESLYTVGYWLYREVSKANGQVSQYPYIAAVGILCTLVCIPVTFAARWVLNKCGPSME